MIVNVPAFLSVRRSRFLVVSTADHICRGGFDSRRSAEAHAAKPLTAALAGGSALEVVEKNAVALRVMGGSR